MVSGGRLRRGAPAPSVPARESGRWCAVSPPLGEAEDDRDVRPVVYGTPTRAVAVGLARPTCGSEEMVPVRGIEPRFRG